MTKCPKCGRPLRCPACDGARGGKARVPKGFADPDVQAKAQATRAKRRREQIDAQWDTPEPVDKL